MNEGQSGYLGGGVGNPFDVSADDAVDAEDAKIEATQENQDLVEQIASETGGQVEDIPNGKGWKIRIGRLMVRVMNEGGGRTNYYRVSVPGKETFDVEGNATQDPAATHIPITDKAYNQIMNILRGSGYYP